MCMGAYQWYHSRMMIPHGSQPGATHGTVACCMTSSMSLSTLGQESCAHRTGYHMMTLCTRWPMISSGPSARLLVRPPAAAVGSPGRPTSAPSVAALVLKLPRSDEDGVPALLPGPQTAAPVGPAGDAAAAAPLSRAKVPPAGPPAPAAARPELAGWCTTLLSRCNCDAACVAVPPACAGGPSPAMGGGALVMEGSGMRPKSGMPSPCPCPGRGRATDRLPGLETTPGASERPPLPPAAPSG